MNREHSAVHEIDVLTTVIDAVLRSWEALPDSILTIRELTDFTAGSARRCETEAAVKMLTK